MRNVLLVAAMALGMGTVANAQSFDANRQLDRFTRSAFLATLDQLDATHEEITSLIETGDGPSAAELAERTRQRIAAGIAGAPPVLGPPPASPPPADWFPPKAVRMEKSMGAVLMHMFREKSRLETWCLFMEICCTRVRRI